MVSSMVSRGGGYLGVILPILIDLKEGMISDESWDVRLFTIAILQNLRRQCKEKRYDEMELKIRERSK